MRIVLSALVIAVLAVVAAGCGGNSNRQAAAATTSSTPSPKACKLTPAQRRDLAKSRRDISRLKQIEKPLHTFTQHGTPAQERLTSKLLLDSGNLPVLDQERMIRLGKAAVGLCGLCFGALEAEEPALADKSGRDLCGG